MIASPIPAEFVRTLVRNFVLCSEAPTSLSYLPDHFQLRAPTRLKLPPVNNGPYQEVHRFEKQMQPSAILFFLLLPPS